MDKKRLANQLYLCAMCALCIVIVVLINLIARRIPEQYTQLDISANKLYTLSLQTQEQLAQLTEPVTLNLIAPTGEEDAQLLRLLNRYTAESDLVTVRCVDPILMPAFVASYTNSRVSDNSILVANEEGRYRLLRNADLYPSTYSYDNGGITTGFDGEGQITSAIYYVTSDSLAKAYILTGHGEDTLPESFMAALEKEGITTGTLNLLTVDSVPQDADCLLWDAPLTDITESEETVLRTYLENGGHLLLLSGVSDADTPDLDRLLSGYGMQAQQGLIIECDSSQYVPNYQTLLLPQMLEHEIIDPLRESDALVLLPNAHALREADDVRSTLTLAPLLRSSASSYLKGPAATDYQYADGDAIGPFYTAMAASEETAGGQARIVWVASSDLLTDDVDEMVSGSNTDFLLNALAWLTQRESGITIRPKQQTAAPVRLTAAQAAGWSAVFTMVLPVLTMAVGIVVCVRRKKRV